MESDRKVFIPSAPTVFERFDRFEAQTPEDEAELRRLWHQVVAARARTNDPLAIEDAIERTEWAARHLDAFLVGEGLHALGTRYTNRLYEEILQRSDLNFQPEPYPVTLLDHYERWLILENRYRTSIAETRGVDDTILTVIVGTDGADSTESSIEVQTIVGDQVVRVESSDALVTQLAKWIQQPPPTRWLSILNAGDLLATYAYAAMTRAAHESSVIVYADQDEVDSSGRHQRPWLKSADHGIYSALSFNVLGEALLIRTSALARASSESRTAFVPDLLLRLDEASLPCQHVATVVLTRPTNRPSYVCIDDLVSSTHAALIRRGWGGKAQAGSFPGTVTWEPEDPVKWPTVQIVIPTRDYVNFLQACIQSIETLSTYPHYSITIVDNGSVESATQAYLQQTPHRVVRDDSRFHFAHLVNLGARDSDSEFVLLLNNDIVIHDPDWIQQMVKLALLPGIGVVGSQLSNVDGSLSHCGVAVPIEPLQLSFPVTYPTDDAIVHSTHDSLAVLGACQMVSRALWNQLGGHDEVFQIECTDVDISLRARELGYRTVVTANTCLTHYGKLSRGEASRDDIELFSYRWGVGAGFQDPYYTPLVRFEPGPRFVRLDTTR